MTRPLLLLLLLSAALLGCSTDAEPEGAGVTREQACEKAQEATAAYNEALATATTPEQGRQAIVGTAERLRAIEAPAPVDEPVAAVADALTGALQAIEAQDQAAFRSEVARIQTTTRALGEACGSPE